ncbi:MAG: hypothetical protein ACXW11_00930 [Methylotenera sp.]
MAFHLSLIYKLIYKLFVGLILVFNASQALAEASFRTTQSDLPDLGQHAGPTNSLNYNVSTQAVGVTYKDTFNSNNLIVTPEFSQQNGFALSGSFASKLTNNFAVGFVPAVSSDKQELLVNTGFGLTNNQRLILTLSQLRQKLNFSFLSWPSQVEVTQNNGAFSYQYLFRNTQHSTLKINGYLSDTELPNLADRTNFTDTAAPLELWDDSLRITGSRVAQLHGRLLLDAGPSATLRLGLSGERLKYKLSTGGSGITRVTCRGEWNQSLSNNLNFKAGLKTMASQNIYNVGIAHSDKKREKIRLNFVSIHSHGGTPNDKQIQLTYSYNFGGPNLSSKRPSQENIRRVKWSSVLEDQVSTRPTFIPTYVVAN